MPKRYSVIEPYTEGDEQAICLVFSALADPTRLTLLARLPAGARRSIAQLGAGLPISRQAVTKHLAVLEEIGLVHSKKEGRQMLFSGDDKPLLAARTYLDNVSAHWDQSLVRLQQLIEREAVDSD